MKTVYDHSDAQLLALIQANIDIQKRNHWRSEAATKAREANHPYFDEAARRNLRGYAS